MIVYLEGRIRKMPGDGPEMVLLTDSGIGYEVTLPAFVNHGLRERGAGEGDRLGLEIYYHVTERQPRPVLVGFEDSSQKEFFELLVGVEGIGPARAAAALVFPIADIARAIEDEDVTLLRRMPGIGDRAAQKIVASLKGKVTDWAMGAASAPAAVTEPSPEEKARNAAIQEAVDILVSLGHRPGDAKAAVSSAMETDPALVDDIESLIRQVFRSLVADPRRAGAA